MLGVAASRHQWGSLPFRALFFFGFDYVSGSSLSCRWDIGALAEHGHPACLYCSSESDGQTDLMPNGLGIAEGFFGLLGRGGIAGIAKLHGKIAQAGAGT